jgi:hypothetical protein
MRERKREREREKWADIANRKEVEMPTLDSGPEALSSALCLQHIWTLWENAALGTSGREVDGSILGQHFSTPTLHILLL